MKTKLAVGLVLVLVLIVGLGFGCEYPSKAVATGGGWLEECASKVNFGFNVQATLVGMGMFGPDYDYKGQFQLVDHAEKLRIHGTFDGKYGKAASGECTINGEGPFTFTLYVDDWGEPAMFDYLKVRVYIPGGGSGNDHKYQGTIDGGNIQVHKYHYN
jgi:hypothetical protein